MRRAAAWFDERINPIALAELRRGLRAKLFSISFSLMAGACVLIALAAWVEGGDTDGKQWFLAFYGCTAVVLFWILPYNAYRSVLREQEEQTLPLVVLTGMSAGRLILGKVQSQLLQALIFGSIAAPFLLLSFLLQGIDLFAVALILAGTLLLHSFLTVMTASAATFHTGRLRRNAGNVGVVLGLGWMTSAAVSASGVLLESNAREELTAGLAVAAWLMVSYGAIALAAAIGRLTFASDNRVYWTRLALIAHLVGTSAIALLIHLTNSPGMGFGIVFAGLGLLHAFIAGIVLVGDEDGMSRRVRQNLPRLRLFGLLLPGARRGLWTFALLVIGFASMGAALTVDTFGSSAIPPSKLDLAVYSIPGAAAFVVLYITVPILLARGPLNGFFNTPARVRTFCVFFLFCAVIAPPVVLDASSVPIHLFNPIRALAAWSEEKTPELVVFHATALGIAALSSLLVCDRVLAAREKETLGG